MATVKEHFPGVINTAAVATEVTEQAVTVEGATGADAITLPADVAAPITSQSEVTLSLPVPEAGSRSAIVDTSVVHTELYPSTAAVVMPLSEAGFDVDIVGMIDSSEKYQTPTVTLNCRA